MKTIENISYGNLDSVQKIDLYLPDGAASSMFVYFHGGGLVGGNKNSAGVFAPYLTSRGIAIASANYRMYPDAEYPDFICDAAQAVAWTNEYMRKELGGERLYIGGSSAGGYLSMMLCFDKRYLERVGLDNSKVAGYFHDAGQPTAHFNVLKYADIDPRRIIVDETAPLYYVGLEKEYPPMRFVVSDNDMKNRYEQTMLMLSTLSHFGYQNFDHIVMHGKHCEYCGKIDNDGESVFGQMIYDFVKRFE
ncbi:MAG: alpha/beta hydrolase [Oscillospiraceae bacterium]|nr:alpha/beta hydrolase [Oscillospiraceae bacterium]